MSEQTVHYFMVESHARELCFWLQEIVTRRGDIYGKLDSASVPAGIWRISQCDKEGVSGAVNRPEDLKSMLARLIVILNTAKESIDATRPNP